MNDVELLKETLSKAEYKIISFDIESDKLLEKYNFKHNTVDEYFSKYDELEMDEKSIELTRNWYLNKEIKEHLEYNEMNLGSLLEIELIGYFFEYIKRITAIIKIIEKENPEIITTSFLTKCAEPICKQKKIKLIRNESGKKVELFFDHIEIPLTFKGKIITIKISRKKFLIMKKILNKLINLIYKTKPNLKKMKNKKSILLLDYNPIWYKELLNELSNSEYQILLLNQRRPAIWNFSSFHIIKNSNCKIIELNDFLNKEVNNMIENDKKNLEIKLKKIWNFDVFNKIFSVKGFSFWDAMKNDLSSTLSKRFLESVERYQLTKKLFDDLNIKSIFEWAHVGMEDKIIIFNANKKRIPNMFLQHGLILQNPRIDKYNPILSIFPTNGSKHAVWGEIVEKFLLEKGINKNEIVKVGSPRHDNYFIKNKNIIPKKILIATNGFFATNSNGTNSKNFRKMELAIHEILRVLKNNSEKEIIVKLHPGIAQKSYDVKKIIQKIDPKIKIFQNENILDLLKESYAMISLNYSSVILDAMVTQTPSMVFLPEDQGFENEIVIKENIVLNTSDVNQIENLTKMILNDEISREEMIKKGNKFVNEYFVNKGNSSNEIRKILENYEQR